MKNPNREVWEGWTVKDFVEDLEPCFALIMRGESFVSPFADRKSACKWIKENQPYYKKAIPEVNDYFCKAYGLK